MLAYEEPLYRPPSEAQSLILQATIGCSFNRCSFCSMYRSKEYRERPLSELEADIRSAARLWPDARKIFLADGDAFTLPTDHLLRILDLLDRAFPELLRVSAYAWPTTIRKKSDAELRKLKAARMSLAYVGLESGSDLVLRKIRKGANGQVHAEAITRLRDAGIKVSATAILGLGGRRYADEHIDGTVELVEAASPNFLSTLQLGLAPEIADEFVTRFDGEFAAQDDHGMLVEQRRLLSRLRPSKPVIFRSNHASNSLALAGVLPRDSRRLVAEVDQALSGQRPLRPEHLRGY